MAGKRRSSSVGVARLIRGHPRGLPTQAVPQRPRWWLAGASGLALSLLLASWALVVFHHTHAKVGGAVAFLGHPAASGEGVAHSGSSSSNDVAAAVAAAAGALAADGGRGGAGAGDHQQQVQVQVTVTHVDAQQHSKQQADTTPDPAAAAAQQSSSCSGTAETDHHQPQLESAKPHAAAPAQPGGPPPKVALLFLVTDSIANEAVWRAFFQAAAQLQLKQPVAAAAAATAERLSQLTVADALTGPVEALHPDVGAYAPWVYPGYRVQHGLTSGAEPPPPRPNGRSGAQPPPANAAAAGARQDTAARAASAAASAGSSAAFPGAVPEWERQLVQRAVLNLTAASTQHSVRTNSTGEAAAVQQSPWSPFKQLSTMREALAAAAAQGISLTPLELAAAHAQPTGGLALPSPGHQHQWHTDHTRCLTSLGLLPPLPTAATQTRTLLQQPSRQQQLFSVYVHTTAGALLPSSSVLSGCELPVRLNTSRGYAQHVLAEAGALLLAAALSDPLNANFVLVSDTSIPLYPPQVIWSQLMAERLSRLDACITPGRDTQLFRWRALMGSKFFGRHHWRKSSQWFVLGRAHALLAVHDVHVREMLHRYCYTNMTRNYPTCVTDEHWLSSLMATYGLDNQTDCEGNGHFADWSLGGWHPKTFAAHDLTPVLVQHMRAGVPLAAARAFATQLSQQSQAGARAQPFTAAASNAGAVPVQGQAQPVSAADNAVSPARVLSHTSAPRQRQTTAGLLAAAMAECRSDQALATALQHIFEPLGQSSAGPQGRLRLQQPVSSTPFDAAASLHGMRNASSEHWLVAAGYMPLGQRCPLFARKFPASIQHEVLSMALSCAGLGLGPWCV